MKIYLEELDILEQKTIPETVNKYVVQINQLPLWNYFDFREKFIPLLIYLNKIAGDCIEFKDDFLEIKNILALAQRREFFYIVYEIMRIACHKKKYILKNIVINNFYMLMKYIIWIFLSWYEDFTFKYIEYETFLKECDVSIALSILLKVYMMHLIGVKKKVEVMIMEIKKDLALPTTISDIFEDYQNSNKGMKLDPELGLIFTK